MRNKRVADYLNDFYKKQNDKSEEKNISKGRLIFRGQSTESWSIMSSAGRRLFQEGKYRQNDLIRYHINLIANARKYGYGQLQAGSQLNDLEML